MSNTNAAPLFIGGLHIYTQTDLTNAHGAINLALKTATNEEAGALLNQRRELNLISAAQEREALKAELNAAEITLTRGELKALYTVEGGEPISGAELDELNEGDQDTRAAIRAAYHGESYEGQGASVELYTPTSPRYVVKTAQDPRARRYTKRYKAAIIELEPGLSTSFTPAMISDRARGVARIKGSVYDLMTAKQLEVKVAELQAKADKLNLEAEKAERRARAKTRANAKARGRHARLKAQPSH